MHSQRQSVIVNWGFDEHLELIMKFEAVNFSDDETDTDGERRRLRENRFRIIQKDWMSEELRAFLRFLDKLYIRDYESSPLKRSSGGSGPRERVTTNPIMSELGVPVRGLRRNCYNERWLETLAPHEYRALEIVEKPYAFVIEGLYPPKEFIQGNSRG